MDFNAQFTSVRGSLPGVDTADRQRAAAMEIFNRSGMPTRKLERWRYTDLRPIDDNAFDLSTACDPTAADLQDAQDKLSGALLAPSDPVLVLIDGAFSMEASRLPADLPFSVQPMLTYLRSGDTGLFSADAVQTHPLALLNTAFTRDGVHIRVPAGTECATPITIAFIGGSRVKAATQPRVIVELGERASLSLVFQFFDLTETDSWTNLVTQLELAANARLSLLSVQEHGSRKFHTSLTHATLDKDAQMSAGFIDFGGKLVRHDVDISLREPGANIDLFGTFLAIDAQHVDIHLCVDHAAANTRSTESFRGIVGARSRGVFNGKVIVRPDAQRIEAEQRSDNLLLDETAEVDAKPELEIYADDVKCSHGATVGELDEQHLFYLQSRGISADAARALLTFAFANAALDKIEWPDVRDAVARRVAECLPKHERWEELT